MLRIYAALSAFLLFAPTLPAQVIVGDAVPLSEITAAKAMLEKATPKTLTFDPGEFEVLEPSKALTGPLLWLSSNEEALQRIEVAANQPLGLWMKRRGEAAARLHQFPAKPFAWVILIGATVGNSQLTVIRNGTAGPPVVVETLMVTVGTPKPPPPPIDNPLTKALRDAYQRDSVAGIGSRDHLEKLEGVYQALSNSDLSRVKTQKELTELMVNSVKGAGIPGYEASLTNTRKALQKEYLARQGISDDAASDAKPVNQALVKQMFSDFAASLGALTP